MTIDGTAILAGIAAVSAIGTAAFVVITTLGKKAIETARDLRIAQAQADAAVANAKADVTGSRTDGLSRLVAGTVAAQTQIALATPAPVQNAASRVVKLADGSTAMLTPMTPPTSPAGQQSQTATASAKSVPPLVAAHQSVVMPTPATDTTPLSHWPKP